MAYTLQLPTGANIHPTFHVSLLKKLYGPIPPSVGLPTNYPDQQPPEPKALIDRRTIKRHNHAVTEWMIKWKNNGAENATWELAEKIEQQFPNFDPWGQGSNQGEALMRAWPNTLWRPTMLSQLEG